MNDTVLEYLLGRARAKSERAGQIVRFTHVGQPTAPIVFDTDEPRGTLAHVIDRGWNDWIVHPSGLCLPSPCVNWFWYFIHASPDMGSAYRIGSAEQARRFAQGYSHPTDDVAAVPASSVHGTCVREDRPNTYRLIQARSFPHWAGM